MFLTPDLIKNILKAELVCKYRVRIDILRSKFSLDSRNLKKGEIFVAIKGEHYDAHDFIECAYLSGASAVITRKDAPCPEVPIPIIRVDDPVKAMEKLAAILIRHYQPIVVGVTGSNGKTTSKELIAASLKQYGKTCWNKGNLNSLIGLPLSVLNADFPCKFLVLEMGMLNPGDIDLLNQVTLPKVGVITNIGSAHIGFLKSVEAIAEEKAKIFQNGCTAVLNFDNSCAKILCQKAKESNATIVSFGTKDMCDVQLLDYSNNIVSVKVGDIKYSYTFPNYGLHFVYATLATIGTLKALELKITNKVLESAFSTFCPHKGRGQQHDCRINGKQIKIIDDTYNANCESISALLDYLKTAFSGSPVKLIIASLGDICEKEEEVYQRLSELLKSVENLTLVGSDGIKMVQKQSEHKVTLYATTQELIDNFEKDNQLVEGTVIAIKGSRFMALEKFVTALLERAEQPLPVETIK